VERVDGVFEVSGEGVERLALKTDWDNQEGVEHFQRELERKGVVAALRRAGAQEGDEVRVGGVEFGFE
jgi:GTP-binding protein